MCDILVFKSYIYILLVYLRMKSRCTGTTEEMVNRFLLTDRTMSRYTRGTGRGANNGNAPDMRTMFTDFMREILRDVQRAAPNAANGGGAAVQAPRADFTKLCQDCTSLGGKPFHGTKSATEVQDWLDSCEHIFKDLGIEDEMKRKLASRQLQGRAMDWWNAIKVATPKDQVT